MSEDIQTFKAQQFWAEIRAIIEEWIQYGDDPFEDAKSEIAYQLESCKDPEYTAVLREVLATMEMLSKYCPRLR
jgi:hypothetical protein